MFFCNVYEADANKARPHAVFRARGVIQRIMESRDPFAPQYQPFLEITEQVLVTTGQILEATKALREAYAIGKTADIERIETKLQDLEAQLRRNNEQLELDPDIKFINPDHPDFYNQMESLQKQIEDEIASFTQALNINNHAVVYFEMGMEKLYHSKAYEEALTHFEDSRGVDPNYAPAYYGIGVVSAFIGDSERAIRNLNQAVALDIGPIGDLQQAIRDLDQAIDLNPPNHVFAHYYMGLVHHHIGNNELALEKFRKAIDLDPSYVPAHRYIGLVHYRIGNNDLALESFRQAIALDPNYVLAHFSIGKVYHSMGNNDLALESFRQAIALDPSYVLAHLYMGVVHYRMGNNNLALESFKQAIALNPDYASAYYVLANIYIDSHNYKKAIENVDTFVRLKPNNERAYELKHKYYNHVQESMSMEATSRSIIGRTKGNQPAPPFESWFEVDVFLEIHKRGYTVIPQFKVSPYNYRIDLVVHGFNGKRLAVECDGPSHNKPKVKQNDLKRQSQLEKQGWEFWRISWNNFYSRGGNPLQYFLGDLFLLGRQRYNFQFLDDFEFLEAFFFGGKQRYNHQSLDVLNLFWFFSNAGKKYINVRSLDELWQKLEEMGIEPVNRN